MRTLVALKLIVWALWPVAAMATGLTLAETIHATPLLAWLMVVLMAGISGLAALLNRIKDVMPPNLPLFATAHMIGSVLSGVLAFAVSEMASVPGWGELVAIIVASYGGASFVDRMSRRYIDKHAPGGTP